jgi:hypothetical protein
MHRSTEHAAAPSTAPQANLPQAAMSYPRVTLEVFTPGERAAQPCSLMAARAALTPRAPDITP